MNSKIKYRNPAHEVFTLFMWRLGVIAIAVALLLQFPAVQDQLVERAITQQMSSVPDDLFTDDALRATLCGSAAPMPKRGRAAACVMIIAGGKFYIVDTGNRSTNNLGLWRIPSKRVGAVLLTHFHSDHIGDLGTGRDAPLTVFGPEGLAQVVEGFSQAYALDSLYRTAHHGAKYLDPANGKRIANIFPIDSEDIYQENLNERD
jgi:ribonuclease Z